MELFAHKDTGVASKSTRGQPELATDVTMKLWQDPSASDALYVTMIYVRAVLRTLQEMSNRQQEVHSSLP